MTQPLRATERRVWIRLSDVPKDKRLAAAAKLADVEIKTKEPMQALIASSTLHRVANDPALAAATIPDECSNKLFQVPAELWERVCRNGSRA